MKFKLVIFDWDGTLMNSADKISTCVRAAAQAVGVEQPSVESAKNIIGLGLLEAMQRLYPDHSKQVWRDLVEAYRHQWLNVDTTRQCLFDDVESGLAALAKTGVLLSVATGKSRKGLDKVLHETQLASYFVVTRCADETRSKPHPQMLEQILDFTGLEADQAVMVGDTSFDMDMASAIGMTGLGAGYGVHSKSMLSDCGAVDVFDSAKQMFAWLLDQRVEAAYG